MARKIAVFENQQHVIGAIEQLEQAGFSPGAMMVLAKNSEHSKRIEAETDVEADEIHELESANRRNGDFEPSGVVFGGGYGLAGLTGAFGVPGNAGSSAVGMGVPFGGIFNIIDQDHSSAYRALGLDEKEAELCRGYVESGALVLIAETDDSKSLLDKDGGPDLSQLGIAEAVFRRCGAVRIADGN